MKNQKGSQGLPSYWGILPASVRYADEKKVHPRAKILFTEITALCNLYGYCNASNSYFAKLYGVTPGTVSKWVSQLESIHSVKTEYMMKPGSKAVAERRIYLEAGILQADPKHLPEFLKGISQKEIGIAQGEKGIAQGEKGIAQGEKGIAQGGKGNSIEENKKKDNIKGEAFTFENFWDQYGKKVGKSTSMKKWAKLKPAEVEAIRDTLQFYLDATTVDEDWKGPFRPMRKDPATYINQKVWEDYEGKKAQEADKSVIQGTSASPRAIKVTANDLEEVPSVDPRKLDEILATLKSRKK